MTRDYDGAPMQDVLTPAECAKMTMFLRALVTYSNKGKLNVGKFILAYRVYVNGHRDNRGAVVARYSKHCEWCGREYEARKINGRYCGTNCAGAANRDRRRRLKAEKLSQP